MPGHRLYLLLVVLAAAGAQAGQPGSVPVPLDKGHALLIGCTAYPNLDVPQLEGPANDVVLMRLLLTSRFGFHKDNIVTLSEAEAKTSGHESRRPTRANIKAQFDQLAAQASQGQQVVILMSGHGSKVPVLDRNDPNNYEPDGVDEVFLCADAAAIDEQTHVCPGTIVDNELGAWVQRIADRGAHVWIIVDSCHSGTMLRGPAEETERRAPMDKLLPPKMLAALKTPKADLARTRGGAAAQTVDVSQLPASLTNVAVLYASQPEESTIELVLPPDNPKRQKYGLLTYTVNEVLMQARGKLTYRELAQRVKATYTRLGREVPVPFLEGQDEALEVLGFKQWPQRSTIKVVESAPEMIIDAGSLQGLTSGTVLSVLPSDVADGDKPLGFVKITQLGSVASIVMPTQYGDAPSTLASFPKGARCEVAFVDYGLRKLRVFVDIVEDAARKQVTGALSNLETSSLIVHTLERVNADWVLHAEVGQLMLEPGSGIEETSNTPSRRFGPIAIDDKLSTSLRGYLGNIVRARNLLAVSREVPLRRTPSACQVKFELVRLRDKQDKVGGLPIQWHKNGIQLHKDELIGCRLQNIGDEPVDATLLFIDSGYGIETQFPLKGAVQKRIYNVDPPLLAYRGMIDEMTLGTEHMVLIAVPGVGPTIDFRMLDQPTLPMLRGNDASSRALDSPLGQLLKYAMYGQGGCRGGNAHELGDHQIEVISWQVVRGSP